MSKTYQALSEKMATLYNLQHLEAMAEWDEAVMMPVGSGEVRAKAMATLATVMHELQTSAQLGECIQEAKNDSIKDPWQLKNIELIEKNYLRATAVPGHLVAESTQARMACQQAWRQLRALNNWKEFKPLLQKTFNLTREIAVLQAEALQCDPYDALIDEHSRGFKRENIDPIFATLKKELPPRIEKIMAIQKEESYLKPKGPFSIEKQRQLGLDLMQALGFDFQQGRLDVSHHPFCGGTPGDIRITTRYNEDEFITAAMGICHETGHARYEQGLPLKWRDQPVGRALGMAVHESQSLLVEMYACRTLEFMHFLEPRIRQFFGDNESYSADNLYKLYSRVKPGYIRVDADEVTYPLHVILRYELEEQLFRDALSIDDLPEAWDQKMQEYFNLSTQGDFKNGLMQDVHWPAGVFGYFPAYTLGSLIAAQLFDTMKKTYPTLLQEIKQGDFTTLFSWLNEHIHQRASSVDVNALIQDASGSPLDPRFYLSHIDQRFR
jgi:carboxypeptidase Taq